VLFADHVERDGMKFFEAVRARDLIRGLDAVHPRHLEIE
jgi:hypothetical protein